MIDQIEKRLYTIAGKNAVTADDIETRNLCRAVRYLVTQMKMHMDKEDYLGVAHSTLSILDKDLPKE